MHNVEKTVEKENSSSFLSESGCFYTDNSTRKGGTVVTDRQMKLQLIDITRRADVDSASIYSRCVRLPNRRLDALARQQLRMGRALLPRASRALRVAVPLEASFGDFTGFNRVARNVFAKRTRKISEMELEPTSRASNVPLPAIVRLVLK